MNTTMTPKRSSRGRFAALALAAIAWLPALPALAEGQLRIAEQFGIVYLLLDVAKDQQLIEKHGKKQGLDIKVEWAHLSGGAAINDALLGGSIDIAAAGVGPLLTLWDGRCTTSPRKASRPSPMRTRTPCPGA